MMPTTCTVFILDPALAQIRVVNVTDLSDLSIRLALSCDAVDSMPFDDVHALYFNDEGIHSGISHYILMAGHPDPIVGPALLAPRPGLGLARPMLLPQTAAVRFRLFRPVMDPIITSKRMSVGDTTTFVSAVQGFNTRIEEVGFEAPCH